MKVTSRIALGAMTVLTYACVYETLDPPVNCEINPVSLQVLSVEDADCALQDGRIEVQASGGEGEYFYTLNFGTEQPSPVFSNLGAGVYEVSVRDSRNCLATAEVTVRNETGLNIEFEVTDAGCGQTHASISITPSDGEPPYQFRIGEDEYQSENIFENLARGNYMISVRDASGCEVNQTVSIRSGVSFANTIQPIIQHNCAVSDCHNGSQFPDLRVFKNIQDNASLIKTLTSNRTMPKEGTLTQEQINAIACWVDDGAPNN